MAGRQPSRRVHVHVWGHPRSTDRLSGLLVNSEDIRFRMVAPSNLVMRGSRAISSRNRIAKYLMASSLLMKVWNSLIPILPVRLL